MEICSRWTEAPQVEGYDGTWLGKGDVQLQRPACPADRNGACQSAGAYNGPHEVQTCRGIKTVQWKMSDRHLTAESAGVKAGETWSVNV